MSSSGWASYTSTPLGLEEWLRIRQYTMSTSVNGKPWLYTCSESVREVNRGIETWRKILSNSIIIAIIEYSPWSWQVKPTAYLYHAYWVFRKEKNIWVGFMPYGLLEYSRSSWCIRISRSFKNMWSACQVDRGIYCYCSGLEQHFFHSRAHHLAELILP